MGTKGTNSNVAWQLQNTDTGGHEKDSPSKCENESRRFSLTKERRREEVAGCGDDEFGNRVGAGKDFGEIDFGTAKKTKT
jgi:hypothetical protein